LPDPEFGTVLAEIRSFPNFPERTANVIRKAIDNVLQGDRTRRYSIAQLTPEEKKHIGTQVEKCMKAEFFQDRKGIVSDTTIAKIEVDIKNTVGENWMIPTEAVDHLCLLTQISEQSAKYSIGLVRARNEILGKENKDKKRSFLKEGRVFIDWIVRDAPLQVSAFLVSTPTIREAIFAKKSGQAAVAELFRRIQAVPIHRADIEAVAAAKDKQVDVRARVRDAKTKLNGEGLLVLRGWNPPEKDEAVKRGYLIDRKHCISIPLENHRDIPE
jgi:hypothetical protein